MFRISTITVHLCERSIKYVKTEITLFADYTSIVGTFQKDVIMRMM